MSATFVYKPTKQEVKRFVREIPAAVVNTSATHAKVRAGVQKDVVLVRGIVARDLDEAIVRLHASMHDALQHRMQSQMDGCEDFDLLIDIEIVRTHVMKLLKDGGMTYNKAKHCLHVTRAKSCKARDRVKKGSLKIPSLLDCTSVMEDLQGEGQEATMVARATWDAWRDELESAGISLSEWLRDRAKAMQLHPGAGSNLATI